MRIWLVQTGEEMPSDGANTRLLRTCILAGELARRGHEVVYLNSTFNHQKKRQRYDRTTEVDQPGGYRSVFLYGRSYTRNIGFRRILSHRDNARSFRKWAAGQPLPDLIHCGLPPIELAAEASRFATRNRVPSTIDCRDVWPEIIEDHLNPVARLLGAPLLRAWKNAKCTALTCAAAITGVSEGFVEWGVRSAGRGRGQMDRAFHLATPLAQVDDPAMAEARQYWAERLGDFPPGGLVVCYAGTYSSRFDFPAILDGADLLTARERERVRIVLCGSGDMDEMIARRSRANPAIVHGGWRTRPQLLALMEIAAVGLLPYPNSRDFLVTFPNKVGEYLTSGLPIMTGTKGAIEDLLAVDSLRIGYEAGDPADFASTLRDLAERDDLGVLRERAKALAMTLFNPAAIYPAFADWIEAVGRQGRPAQ